MCNRFLVRLFTQPLGIYQIRLSKLKPFSAFSLFLLADLIVQHYVTPDHWICIYDLVKNVFYLFHNVILSFLVKH